VPLSSVQKNTTLNVQRAVQFGEVGIYPQSTESHALEESIAPSDATLSEQQGYNTGPTEIPFSARNTP
jgi:hypothetical protein